MQKQATHKEPLGLLIAATRRRIKQIVLTRAAQFGLTPQQFWLLVALEEGGGQSLHALAVKLAVLAREIRGLVERDLTPDERELVRAALRKILASLEAAA